MRDLLATLRWRDAVDILLVTLVIYRVFVLFRGTRAVQMVAGLAVLVIASLVARALELHTMQWILDNFWAFWVLAFIVLFQPELRRALASIGQGRLLQRLFGSRDEQAHVVDAIVGAADTLAARRVGALIVIERSTGLRQYAELGVPLDALVSSDLLVSLFLPASPLHDGAVFVQGGRLVAAGCFLPLSRSTHIGRALGTRHRAALGISEETDAVALAVSEETSAVSLAVDGHIEAVADVAALRARLNALLGGDQPSAQPARRWRVLLRRAQDPS